MSILVRKNQDWSENTLDGASKGETILTISVSDTSGSDQEYKDITIDEDSLTSEQEARIMKALKDLEEGNFEDYEPL